MGISTPTGELDVTVGRPAASMAADQFSVVAGASAAAARATALAAEARNRGSLAEAAAQRADDTLQAVGVAGARAAIR